MLELNHILEFRNNTDKKNTPFFRNVDSSFIITESDVQAALKEAIIDMKEVSGLAVCNDKFFTGSHFCHYKTYAVDFQLNRGCDGMLLTTCTGKENYLVLIELKSSPGQALSDAPYQIATSYIKAMSFFADYGSFISDEYKTIAIILYTEHELDTSQQSEKQDKNGEVNKRRKSVVANRENPGRKYYRENIADLKSNKAVDFLMNGEDFGSDQLHLNPAIVMHDLPVHVRCVDHPNASFDLLPFLEGL